MRRTILAVVAAILALATYAIPAPAASAGGMNMAALAAPQRPPEYLEITIRPVVATLTVQATSYCLSGTTATGTRVGLGTIAVDPQQIPFGTQLYVQGYGYGTALDDGPAITQNHVDLWLPPTNGCAASWTWGRRDVAMEILGPPRTEKRLLPQITGGEA